MCTGHEVCAEQREADGVSALGGKLQALLEHLFKRTAVEATHTRKTDKTSDILVLQIKGLSSSYMSLI